MPLLIAIVKSLRWPGAFTVSNKGEVDLVSLLAVSTLACCIMGDGIKKRDSEKKYLGDSAYNLITPLEVEVMDDP